MWCMVGSAIRTCDSLVISVVHYNKRKYNEIFNKEMEEMEEIYIDSLVFSTQEVSNHTERQELKEKWKRFRTTMEKAMQIQQDKKKMTVDCHEGPDEVSQLMFQEKICVLCLKAAGFSYRKNISCGSINTYTYVHNVKILKQSILDTSNPVLSKRTF